MPDPITPQLVKDVIEDLYQLTKGRNANPNGLELNGLKVFRDQDGLVHLSVSANHPFAGDKAKAIKAVLEAIMEKSNPKTNGSSHLSFNKEGAPVPIFDFSFKTVSEKDAPNFIKKISNNFEDTCFDFEQGRLIVERQSKDLNELNKKEKELKQDFDSLLDRSNKIFLKQNLNYTPKPEQTPWKKSIKEEYREQVNKHILSDSAQLNPDQQTPSAKPKIPGLSS